MGLASHRVGRDDFHGRARQVPLVYRVRAGLWDPCNSPAAGPSRPSFLAFSACASGAYLMNDLFDLAADREHPTKRHRALAAGDLKISSALSAIPALWTFAVAAGLYSLRIGAGAVAAGVVLSE